MPEEQAIQDPWPRQTANSSVKLVHAFGEINNRLEVLEKRLTNAVSQPASAEAAIAKLVPLSNLAEISSSPAFHDLSGASQFIDTAIQVNQECRNV